MKSLDRARIVENIKRDNGYLVVEPRGDMEYVAVGNLMFHATLMVGLLDQPQQYEDRWCYVNSAAAVAALREWQGRGYAGEPTGWHRHPPTGRRRVNGDPTTEYVEW